MHIYVNCSSPIMGEVKGMEWKLDELSFRVEKQFAVLFLRWQNPVPFLTQVLVRLKQIGNGIVVCDNFDSAKSNYLAEVEHPFPFNVKSSPETAFSSSLYYYDCGRKQKIASHMLGM